MVSIRPVVVEYLDVFCSTKLPIRTEGTVLNLWDFCLPEVLNAAASVLVALHWSLCLMTKSFIDPYSRFIWAEYAL